MKLRKINYILAMALLVSSISASAVNVYADTINNINSRAIITDSVVIDKEDSGSTLVPGDILEEVKSGTGSITITLSDTEDNRDKGNVKFGLSKVADVINGEYKVLTGNQTGLLLTDYILSSLKEEGKLPSNGVVIKTIVTSEGARAIANYYGVEIMDVLTGFKYIGEKIRQFQENGDKK